MRAKDCKSAITMVSKDGARRVSRVTSQKPYSCTVNGSNRVMRAAAAVAIVVSAVLLLVLFVNNDKNKLEWQKPSKRRATQWLRAPSSRDEFQLPSMFRISLSNGTASPWWRSNSPKTKSFQGCCFGMTRGLFPLVLRGFAVHKRQKTVCPLVLSLEFGGNVVLLTM